MASGVPVVGVAAGGLVELIEDGKNGFLVSNTDDFKQFSEKVGYLLRDIEARDSMGSRARKWAEGFGWEAATSKLRNK